MSTEVIEGLVRVKIRGENVEVRELTWKKYLNAVKELTGTILGLIGEGSKIILDKQKLLDAVNAQEGLVEWVLVASIPSKDQAWVESLSARELLPLVKAVIELNLSEEIIQSGKEVGGRMAAVLGLGGIKSTSPEPSTTSSATDTPSQTSKV